MEAMTASTFVLSTPRLPAFGRPSPAPLLIPGGKAHPLGSPRPSADDAASIRSGVTIARALFSNPYALSDRGRYASGSSSLMTRQDSATLAPGEHPFMTRTASGNSHRRPGHSRLPSGSSIASRQAAGSYAPSRQVLGMPAVHGVSPMLSVPPVPPMPPDTELLFSQLSGILTPTSYAGSSRTQSVQSSKRLSGQGSIADPARNSGAHSGQNSRTHSQSSKTHSVHSTSTSPSAYSDAPGNVPGSAEPTVSYSKILNRENEPDAEDADHAADLSGGDKIVATKCGDIVAATNSSLQTESSSALSHASTYMVHSQASSAHPDTIVPDPEDPTSPLASGPQPIFVPPGQRQFERRSPTIRMAGQAASREAGASTNEAVPSGVSPVVAQAAPAFSDVVARMENGAFRPTFTPITEETGSPPTSDLASAGLIDEPNGLSPDYISAGQPDKSPEPLKAFHAPWDDQPSQRQPQVVCSRNAALAPSPLQSPRSRFPSGVLSPATDSPLFPPSAASPEVSPISRAGPTSPGGRQHDIKRKRESMVLGHGRVVSTSSLLPISDRLHSTSLSRSPSTPQDHRTSMNSRQRSGILPDVTSPGRRDTLNNVPTSGASSGSSSTASETRKRSSTLSGVRRLPTIERSPTVSGIDDAHRSRSASLSGPPSGPTSTLARQMLLNRTASSVQGDRPLRKFSLLGDRPGTSPGALPPHDEGRGEASVRPTSADIISDTRDAGFTSHWDAADGDGNPHEWSQNHKALPAIPLNAAPSPSPIDTPHHTQGSLPPETKDYEAVRESPRPNGCCPSLPVVRPSEGPQARQTNDSQSQVERQPDTGDSQPTEMHRIMERRVEIFEHVLPPPAPLRVPSTTRHMRAPRTPSLSGPRPPAAMSPSRTLVPQDGITMSPAAHSPIQVHSTQLLSHSIPSHQQHSVLAPTLVTIPSSSAFSEDAKSATSTEPPHRAPRLQPAVVTDLAAYEGGTPYHSATEHDSPTRASVLGSPPPYYTVFWDYHPEADIHRGQSEQIPSDGDHRADVSSPRAAATSSGGASRRVRVRPPLPAGPRLPAQRHLNGTSATAKPPLLAGSWTSIDGSSSSSALQTSSARWRGYSLDVAKLVLSSEELQSTVSHAIRQSARSSSIRLLRPEEVQAEIPIELGRLEARRGEIKAQIVSLKRAREQLLSSLASQSEDTHAQSFVRQLVEDLRNVSSRLDKLAQDFDAAGEQIMRLTSILHIHQSSALSMALRKLNNSFQRKCAETEDLRERVAETEAERNEAWQHASAVAQELDDMCAKSEGPTPVSSRRSSRVLASRKSSMRVSKAGLRRSSSNIRASTISSGVKSVYSPDGDAVPPVPQLPCRRCESAMQRPRALSATTMRTKDVSLSVVSHRVQSTLQGDVLRSSRSVSLPSFRGINDMADFDRQALLTGLGLPCRPSIDYL